jgi:dimethylamine/trimethylamine dehydrogenase
MGRDPRYDVLFEAVEIGPVTARNRFYQVPHCNGMGYRDPSALAEMRAVKAEGGWAVVSTEEVEIHPSSETTPYVEGRLWDDDDLPAHTHVVARIHEYGALAAIELVHNGLSVANLSNRLPPMGPSHQVNTGGYAPIQARAMDLRDIAELRTWYRDAARRSLQAGYDIVYVYAGHSLSTLQHFLSPRHNHRSDEYGGSLENRARLLREVLEDTLAIAEGRAAVACRISVDELLGNHGFHRDEMEELLDMLGELPDLWDFMVGVWKDDSVPSRFQPEGGQEDHVRGLKALTSKPVVGVGRFTSPDTMVRMVRQGVLDFIGAARPSIADPFLPTKIAEGRIDDIRECIGCNMCVSGDFTMSPIRCTQNPAMGEEWRRGWHPEWFRHSAEPEKVLVIGGGPAGLEAAMACGKQGHEVVLVEADRELGGRVAHESRLPGLAEWRRVVDYRVGQIDRLANVTYYFESAMTAEEILEYGFDHIAVATGATWRRDGVGHANPQPIPIDPAADVLTPDDVFAGERPQHHRVVVFDDDHYYLGGVIAELLVGEGHHVTLVTPAADASTWTHHTLEHSRIQTRLLELGVAIHAHHTIVDVAPDAVMTTSVFTDRRHVFNDTSVVLVTSRLPNEGLCLELSALRRRWDGSDLKSVRPVGDAFSPGTIASAIWDGRRFAEELGVSPEDRYFLRDVPIVRAAGPQSEAARP